jgi:hypothetical protein
VTDRIGGPRIDLRPDNAIVGLANAVAKVTAWKSPIRLSDTTRAYFEKLAAVSPPEKAERVHGCLPALHDQLRRVYPGAITLPNLMTRATGMACFRPRGVPPCDTGPLTEERDRGAGGAHSDDERTSDRSLHRFVEFMWNAVNEIAADKEAE